MTLQDTIHGGSVAALSPNGLMALAATDPASGPVVPGRRSELCTCAHRVTLPSQHQTARAATSEVVD